MSTMTFFFGESITRVILMVSYSGPGHYATSANICQGEVTEAAVGSSF